MYQQAIKTAVIWSMLLGVTLCAQAQNTTQVADLVIYAKQSNTRFLVGVNGVQYTAKPVTGIRITEIPVPLCVVQVVVKEQTGATDTIFSNIYLKKDGDYIYTLDTAKQNKQHALYYEAEDVSPKQLKGFLKKTFLPPALKHVVIDTTAMYHARGAAIITQGLKQLRTQWLKKGNCNKTPITNAAFETVKNKIKEKSFESDKLRVAKQQISVHCFLAKQIEELLQLFDFERVKLDVAKFAYHYISDAQNHAVLCNTFEFDTTIAEWNRYIATIEAEITP